MGIEDPDNFEAVRKQIHEGFKTCDALAREDAAELKWKDGCTAVTVVILNNQMYVSNCGDARAVLCRTDKADTTQVKASQLTKDHKAIVLKERERIEKNGGWVEDGRVNGSR